MRPEHELSLLLCRGRDWRAAHEPRIRSITERVDFEHFRGLLMRQRLLPLAGTRLEQAAGELIPVRFRDAVDEVRQRTREHALVQGAVTVELLGHLEATGIPAVPLKGPLLARILYGDPALRRSHDIDILVHRRDLDGAVSVVQ